MIRTLLFDLGNVLIGLEFERAYRAAAELCRHAPGAIGRLLLESGLAQPYETGAIDSAEFHRRACRHLDLEADYDRFAALWGNMFADEPLLDEELLEQLGRDRRLAIVSNTNELHFEWIRARYPMLERFDDYVLSYRVGAMKPEAAIYQAALRATHSRPEECFFVDDKPENVAGARRLGIDAEVFHGEPALREQLRLRGVLD